MKKWLKVLLIVLSIIIVVITGLLIYFKIVFLSKSEVKNIIVQDMNSKEENIHFKEIDLEMNKNYYEVELYYNNSEYEYKINAKNGKIIYSTFSKEKPNNIENQNNYNNNPTNNDNPNTKKATNSNLISKEKAKSIAITKENLTEKDVTFTKIQNDYENGQEVYDIEFNDGKYKYEYEISVTDGTIISYDKDPIIR